MRRKTIYILLFIIAITFMVFTQTTLAGMNRGNGYGKYNGPMVITDPVKIDAGYISGAMFGDPDHPVRIYRGIPYAAPPVGALRWRPPQPVAPWSGIRECTQFGEMVIQTGGVFLDFGYTDSEDSLYLNVVTPAKNPHAGLPVMVWFHGGGYDNATGADPLFNNYRLSEFGVIVVTVNMRLGALGLLAHPDLSAESPDHVSGNYMFLDMIASLEWVQRNIEAFGGDPNNVTIFGESGGGGKVAGLVASPMAAGLFHKGICQSGAAGTGMSLVDMEAWGEALFAKLGVESLAEAREVDPYDIVEADIVLRSEMGGFRPRETIDDVVFFDHPAAVFASGEMNRVPMIVGANLGELGPGIISMPYLIDEYTSMLAGLRSAGLKGYGYIFDQVPINWREAGGVATHALELLYVFGDYDNTTPTAWPLIYSLETFHFVEPVDMTPELTEVDKAVSENMMAMWAQFAKTGNPSKRGLVNWPAWNPTTDKYLYIANPLEVESGFSTVTYP